MSKVARKRKKKVESSPSVEGDKLSLQQSVSVLYDLVRQESKAKKAMTPKDEPVVKPKPVDAKKKRRQEKKAMKSGGTTPTGPTTTIKEIAFDREVTAKELRRMLRKANVPRPGGRWEWATDSDVIEQIHQIIDGSGKGKKRA